MCQVTVKHDILVSPPNRLVHMLQQDLISLNKVEWLVVDEADKLFEAGVTGFREQLATIHRSVRNKIQELFKSISSLRSFRNKIEN